MTMRTDHLLAILEQDIAYIRRCRVIDRMAGIVWADERERAAKQAVGDKQ